jgi:hypothetical protein
MQILFFLKRHWKTAIWTVIMAILLFTPAKNLPEITFLNFRHSDKLVHFFLFLFLEYFLLLERKETFDKLKPKTILLLSFVAIIYGGSSEIIQLLLIKGRSGSWFDFSADCFGIASAYSIYYLHFRLTNRSSSPNS